MASFKLIRCHIKIQLCIGHFPDGRMRTRTFGIGGVRADLSADDAAAVAHALAPLLGHPIVRVRLVRKYALNAPSGADRRRGGVAAVTRNLPARRIVRPAHEVVQAYVEVIREGDEVQRRQIYFAILDSLIMLRRAIQKSGHLHLSKFLLSS